MKLHAIILTTLFLAFATETYAQKDVESKKDLMERAEEVKQKMMEKDPTIKTFFENSEGYAIFPSIGKGGLIIGGAYGNGVVYENGNYIGTATLKQLDIGLQAGGKTYGEIIFFETKNALEKFKGDKFELSAQVSATLIDEGAAKKAKFKNETMVFVLPKKGLMADASIGGQRFTFQKEKDTQLSDF